MAAFSRIRLYADTLSGVAATNVFSIAELSYYDATNTKLIPASVTASSTFDSSRLPANVIDGDPATFWSSLDNVMSLTAEVWIELQFSVPVEPTSMVMVDRARNDQTVIYGRVHGSNDGVTYSLIETVNINPNSVTASQNTYTISLLPKTTSYLYKMGITSSKNIVITTDLIPATGYVIDRLIDGSVITTNVGSWQPASSQTSPKFIKFDLGVGVLKLLKEFTIIKTSASISGVWRMQGSNDDSIWVDESANFNYGGPTPSFTVSAGLTNTYYRYYRLLMVGGTTVANGVEQEIQFNWVDLGGEPEYVSLYGAGDQQYDRRWSIRAAWRGAFNGSAGPRYLLQSVDNSLINHYFGANTAAQIKFDFDVPLVCTEITWRQSTADENGTWTVAFSDDGLTYTDHPTFVPVALTQTTVLSLADNTTPHRFVMLQQVGGTTTSLPNFRGVTFKLGNVSGEVTKDLVLDWSIIASTDVVKDIVLDWQILTPAFNKDLVLDWKIASVSIDYWQVPEGDSVTNETIQLAPIADRTAGGMLGAMIALAGPMIPPSGPSLPPSVGILGGYFYFDFYERIWVSPTEFKLSNPRLNTPTAFNVWNAYHMPNTLGSYSYLNLIGVEVIQPVPLPFDRYERKELTFQILNSAPIRIDGNIQFNFGTGSALLHIVAVIIEALRASPEIPITETWTWKTVVNIAYNSAEQRSALRLIPRISTSFLIYIQDEADRRYQYGYLSSFISRNVQIPFYQYATQLTAGAVIGATEIFYNNAVTFIKPNTYVSIFNPQTETSELIQVLALTATGATLVLPLDFDIPPYALIVPLVDMRMPEGTGFTMRSIAGQLEISATSVNAHDVMRPGSSVALTMFDGLPVLAQRPLADDDVPELFVTGVEVLDNDIAPAAYYTKWPVPFINGDRVFKVVRATEMDYWRTFATAVCGMQNPFLIPTFRNDLPVLGTVDLGSNTIRTTNTAYAEYFPYDTYKRIQIQTANGIVYNKVVSVTLDDDGGLTLFLQSVLGSNAGDNILGYVSYLNKVRLDNDVIDLQHTSSIETFIRLSIRTIEQ